MERMERHGLIPSFRSARIAISIFRQCIDWYDGAAGCDCTDGIDHEFGAESNHCCCSGESHPNDGDVQLRFLFIIGTFVCSGVDELIIWRAACSGSSTSSCCDSSCLRETLGYGSCGNLVLARSYGDFLTLFVEHHCVGLELEIEISEIYNNDIPRQRAATCDWDFTALNSTKHVGMMTLPTAIFIYRW